MVQKKTVTKYFAIKKTHKTNCFYNGILKAAIQKLKEEMEKQQKITQELAEHWEKKEKKCHFRMEDKIGRNTKDNRYKETQ